MSKIEVKLKGAQMKFQPIICINGITKEELKKLTKTVNMFKIAKQIDAYFEKIIKQKINYLEWNNLSKEFEITSNNISLNREMLHFNDVFMQENMFLIESHEGFIKINKNDNIKIAVVFEIDEIDYKVITCVSSNFTINDNKLIHIKSSSINENLDLLLAFVDTYNNEIIKKINSLIN